jgi:hypothetical protein
VPPADILLVSLGGTTGLRESDAELAGSLRRAGADVAVVEAVRPREVRTFALTDLAWALAARRATTAAPPARATLYSTTTAALLAPRPGAIRYDAPAAGNRPGRHGVWQRPLERRRLAEAPLLVPVSEGSLGETPRPHADAVVVPIPVEPSGPAAPERDIAAITYGANPAKKGLDLVLDAWRVARREDETLVVAGIGPGDGARQLGAPYAATPSVRFAGALPRTEYRALLRRARVFACAPRREDYGIAQLEALADGCMLVTTAGPGPYAALPVARALDPRLVTADVARALRTALDDPVPDYADRAREAVAPWSHAAVDRIVAEQLLPRLLA